MGYSGPVAVSVGLSEYRQAGHFETPVAEADEALYTASDPRRTVLFSPTENV